MYETVNLEAPVEAISKDDLDYLKVIAERVNDVQKLYNFHAAYLSDKYKLGQQDSINLETGEIARQVEQVVE